MPDNLDDLLNNLMRIAKESENKEKNEDLPPRRTLIIDAGVGITQGLALSEKDNFIFSLYVLMNVTIRVKQSLGSITIDPTTVFHCNSQMELKIMCDALVNTIEDWSNKLVEKYDIEKMTIGKLKETWKIP